MLQARTSRIYLRLRGESALGGDYFRHDHRLHRGVHPKFVLYRFIVVTVQNCKQQVDLTMAKQ